MNQDIIIKLIRLMRTVIISHIRRAYSRAKRWVLKTKIEKEKQDVEKAIIDATIATDDFRRAYREYKSRRVRRGTGNVRGGSKQAGRGRRKTD